MGLIPACAGKTCYRSVGCCAGWAHPRVCGENYVTADINRLHLGSSPRVRGKLHGGASAAKLCGLIPACAGKTLSIPSRL